MRRIKSNNRLLIVVTLLISGTLFAEPYRIPEPYSKGVFIFSNNEEQYELYEKFNEAIVKKFQYGLYPGRNEGPGVIKPIIDKYKALGLDITAHISYDEAFIDIMHPIHPLSDKRYIYTDLMLTMAKFGNADTIKYLQSEGLDPNVVMFNGMTVATIMAKEQKWSDLQTLVKDGIITDETLRRCMGYSACELTVFDVFEMKIGHGGLMDNTQGIMGVWDYGKFLLDHGVFGANFIEDKQACEAGHKPSCDNYLEKKQQYCERFKFCSGKSIMAEVGLSQD